MFGTTLQDVYALVPEANPERLTQVGITPEVILRWIEELSARVALRCPGWVRLDDSAAAPGSPSLDGETVLTTRAQFVAFASTVVANGAASYLEAARHPERAAVADSSYQHVLWTRFTQGLDELAAWMKGLAHEGDSDGDGVAGLSPRWWFPPATITSCSRW